jgi:hypothetical protein
MFRLAPKSRTMFEIGGQRFEPFRLRHFYCSATSSGFHEQAQQLRLESVSAFFVFDFSHSVKIGYGTLIHEGRCSKFPSRDGAAGCKALTADQMEAANTAEDDFVTTNGVAFETWKASTGVTHQAMKVTPQKAD